MEAQGLNLAWASKKAPRATLSLLASAIVRAESGSEPIYTKRALTPIRVKRALTPILTGYK